MIINIILCSFFLRYSQHRENVLANNANQESTH